MTNLDHVLALARTVKTVEGEKKFKKPVGSLIGPDGEKLPAGGAPASGAPSTPAPKASKEGSTANVTHLKSLKEEMDTARKVGDKSQLALLQKQFLSEFRALTAKSDPKSIMEQINGKASGKK